MLRLNEIPKRAFSNVVVVLASGIAALLLVSDLACSSPTEKTRTVPKVESVPYGTLGFDLLGRKAWLYRFQGPIEFWIEVYHLENSEYHLPSNEFFVADNLIKKIDLHQSIDLKGETFEGGVVCTFSFKKENVEQDENKEKRLSRISPAQPIRLGWKVTDGKSGQNARRTISIGDIFPDNFFQPIENEWIQGGFGEPTPTGEKQSWQMKPDETETLGAFLQHFRSSSRAHHVGILLKARLRQMTP